MVADNTITFFLIIIIIGILAYVYYKKANVLDNQYITPKKPTKKPTKKSTKKPNKKNKNNKHKSPVPISLSLSPIKTLSPSISINDTYVNDDYTNDTETTDNTEESDDLTNSILNDNLRGINTDNENTGNATGNDVCPCNLDMTNPEDLWDSNFGLPLMTKDEKNSFVAKMQQNNRDYQKSLGQFTKYQMDDSTLIKTDITIDPFKPEHLSGTLKGRSIREIYDEQVAGPKVIPKKIKSKTFGLTIYENETENNGGHIKGTSLYGYDGINNEPQSAYFGNQF